MIMPEVDRAVRTEMDSTPIPFTVDAEDFGMLSSILSDKLYSDKPMAVIREYGCNAIDANVEADAKRNILITPPTRFEPIFKIRDFGFGLSREQVENVYVKFAKSTKRGSNKPIGVFGLGCKAGFAYSDSFNIASYTNGYCETYTAQKNRVGKLELFPIAKFESDEPSGIEISLSVEEHDIGTFNSKIAEFAKYCSNTFDFATAFEVPKIDYVCNFEKFFIEKGDRYNSRSCKVVMGNVTYPIDMKNVNESYYNTRNVVLRAEIGDLDINPNRESLEYTPKTKDFLNNLFTEIFDTVKADTQNKINEQKYPWLVHSLVTELNNSFSGSVSFKTSDFTYKGKAIAYTEGEVKYYVRVGPKYFRKRHKLRIGDVNALTLFVLAHEDSHVIPSRLSKGYFAKYGVWPDKIIVSDDTDVYEKLFCSDWEPKQIVADYKSMWSKIDKSGNGPRIIDPNVYAYENGHRRYWNKIGDVKANKNYVAVRFNNLSVADDSDQRYVEAARQLGITFYAIKKSKIKNIGGDWTPLRGVVEKALEQKIKTLDLPSYMIVQEISGVKNIAEIKEMVENHRKTLIAAGEKEVVEIIEKYKKLETVDMKVAASVIALAKESGKEIALVKTPEIAEQVNAVKAFAKRYSLAIQIYDKCAYYYKEQFAENIREYIKMVNIALDKTAKMA